MIGGRTIGLPPGYDGPSSSDRALLLMVTLLYVLLLVPLLL